MKKALRITIVLPFPVTKPVGGAKIMYEYANRLKAAGHTVVVVHSLKRPLKKMKSPLFWKRFVYWVTNAGRPAWFPLNKNIPSLIVDEISNKFLPDADIVFSTWWQMTYATSKLLPAKGRVVNLVQDFEIWAGQEDKVIASYQLPVHHAAIAKHLKELVEKNGAMNVAYFPNAIDTTKFYISKPIADRNPLSIIMLYSEEERKGTKYGIDALVVLKNRFPKLNVALFGVYSKPTDLPTWINYFRKPANLQKLYNEYAIFLTPSLGEGWALPPAEAMACGCAVVCTNISGHADYALNNETALLVTPKNTDEIINSVSDLLAISNKRIQLAINANNYLVKNFNWDKSVKIAEEYFLSIV